MLFRETPQFSQIKGPEMPVTFFAAAAAVTPHRATIRCLLFISVNMNYQSKKSQISIKDAKV